MNMNYPFTFLRSCCCEQLARCIFQPNLQSLSVCGWIVQTDLVCGHFETCSPTRNVKHSARQSICLIFGKFGAFIDSNSFVRLLPIWYNRHL